MKVHDLKPPAGSNTRKRRVGRGIGGKGGKTAGRGTKGQGARDTVPAGFEGGQLPFQQRVPKLKGFNNPFRVEYGVVNLDAIDELDGDVVDPSSLLARGLVHKHGLVKVLGRGQLNRAVTVR
ncbi:MAG TPA: 50S ribosomal protein L15, partial [Acidimicrobiia bacterium]|nr:50S ribosomal protein L15 [Acidimicrobiia bacterium]